MTRPALRLESRAARPPELRPVALAGLRLLTGEYEQVADRFLAWARGSAPVVVAHVNLKNCYALCHWDRPLPSQPQLELIFDGIGLKLAAWMLGRGWVRDLNGTDLFPLVMRRAAAAKLRVFFLGSTASVVRAAAERTLRDFPGVVLAGVHDGHFPMEADAAVAERVRLARPDIVLVGMGCPRQEEFALAQRSHLGAKLVWTTGGLFDFVSGAKPRAPRPLRRLRLEWLYRLLLEPRRMWWRNTVPPLWLAWRALRGRL